MPKDRGAEPEDFDGPLECGLALGTVAAQTRLRVAEQQAAGTLPWIGAHDPEGAERRPEEQRSRMHRIRKFGALKAWKSSSEQMIHDMFHQKNEAQRTSGTKMMETSCVTLRWCFPFLQAFDVADAEIGADRNQQRTEVICCVSDLDTTPPDWEISEVRPLAFVDTAVRGNITLGVAVGPRCCVTDQLLAEADIIQAVRELVQLCQDLQTEFALLRESLGENQPHPQSTWSHDSQ